MSGGVSLSGHGFQSGIEWRMGDQRAAVGPASTGEAAFTAPSSLAPLTLYYQRPSGQARAEGWIDLTASPSSARADYFLISTAYGLTDFTRVGRESEP